MKSNKGAATAIAENEKTENGLETRFDSVKNTVADKIHKAAETIHETSDSAPNRTKESIEAARQFGHRTADKVNDFANQAADKAGQLGHKTADILDTSAEYVRHLETQKVKEAMQQKFYDNPGTTLLIAGVAGFVIGALVARRF